MEHVWLSTIGEVQYASKYFNFLIGLGFIEIKYITDWKVERLLIEFT